MAPNVSTTGERRRRRVLVLGASGYVGGRFVPQLVAAGHDVRCLTRSVDSLSNHPWTPDVDVVEGDLLDPSSLGGAFDGVEVVVYLVHSLDEDGDFEEAELTAAQNTRLAAERAGVERIVYLGGLGADEDLSPHLASRQRVGAELASSDVEVIELRAAVILGAGSASFEMLRSLAEVLPLMLAPRWVKTSRVQPIAIGDVLAWLGAAVIGSIHAGGTCDARNHRVFEIGGPDVMTYAELIHTYCDVAGLARRRLVSVPIIPLTVSSRWVALVTPLPGNLARRLVHSLEHDVVVDAGRAPAPIGRVPTSAARAIEMSLAAVDDLDVPTHWSGRSAIARAAEPRPWDPDWSGGTVLEDRRVRRTAASPDAVMRVLRGIGGDRGWFGFGPLWTIRGLLDQAVGGVGLRRGRRHPDEIRVGEAVDFWRVDVADDDLFRLRAEMRLPGTAWLEWSLSRDDDSTVVEQRARFVPRGVAGRAYWWMVFPFHLVVFPVMLRRLVEAADA